MAEEVTIDDRGRVLIPAEIRKRLRLRPGQRLRIGVSGTSVVLTPVVTKPRRVRANRRWGPEAFLDAGEATFGEEGLGR